MLAYTGLETVANLAEEARRPGIDIPRSLFGAIGVVVALYVAIAVVGLSAFPVSSGRDRPRRRVALRAAARHRGRARRGSLAVPRGRPARLRRRVSGALILLAAATTSVSGFGRLAYSLGEHGMLPRTFGRLGRRTLISPAALASVVVLAAGGLIAITAATDDEVAFLAALFSFGVLLAFAAAQLAVIRLRFTSPELERPYRVPWNVRIAGADVPIPAVVGLVLTLAVWVIAMITHPGARYAGPIWLAAGLVVYGLVRRHRGEGLLERVISPDEQAELAEPVPVEDPRAHEARADRRGDDRDGGEARPGAWLRRRGAPRRARCRCRRASTRLPTRPRRSARSSRSRRRACSARTTASSSAAATVRARSIGEAIVQQATDAGRRSHRARLGAALAQAVALLLAHRRARPPQRSVRGARRRLPGARARRRWLV